MKKICFFCGDISRTGGTERVTSLIANGLVKEPDFEVVILSLFQVQISPSFELYEEIVRSRLFEHPVSLKRHYFSAVSRLRTFLKQNQVDVLIDVDLILDLISIPAKYRLPVRLISWEHFHYHENLGCRLRDLGRWMARRWSDQIVTLTDADLKNYETAGSRVPVMRIYNPIILPEAPPVYDVDSKMILSVGRLTYEKGFDMIPEIAAEIFKNHLDWRWVIVGEGEDRPLLEAEIVRLGLQGRLILAGKGASELWYPKASMLVMTSRCEGFGLVLTEAFSYGLPCLAFDCSCGPSEIIKDSENGFLIPCFEKFKFVNAIEMLIDSEILRISLSNNSRISLKLFDHKSVITQWKSILSERNEK